MVGDDLQFFHGSAVVGPGLEIVQHRIAEKSDYRAGIFCPDCDHGLAAGSEVLHHVGTPRCVGMGVGPRGRVCGDYGAG